MRISPIPFIQRACLAMKGTLAWKASPFRFCRLGCGRCKPVGRICSEGMGTVFGLPLRLKGYVAEVATTEIGPVSDGALEKESMTTLLPEPLGNGGDWTSADQIKNAVSDLKKTANEALGSAKELSDRTTDAVTESLQKGVRTVSTSADDFAERLQSYLDDLTQKVDLLSLDAQEQLQFTRQSIENAFDNIQRQALDSIPPEVKDAVEVAKPFVKSASEFIVTYRIPLLALSVSVIGFSGFVYYRYRIEGYSGDISPKKALELLESDAPTLLVDIRTEDIQRRDGIPKLRRTALGKGISIPFSEFDSEIRKTFKVSPDLNTDITAAYIAGHRQATPYTNFIILSKDDAQGRSVARSLKKLNGQTAFVLLGGFASWKEMEMPVSTEATYELSPVEIAVDKAMDITKPLSRPSNLVFVSAAVTSTAWAVWNYHFVLQMLGLLCPSVGFAVSLLKKYDSMEELLDALDTFLKSSAGKEEMKAADPKTSVAVRSEKSEGNPLPLTESNETVIAES